MLYVAVQKIIFNDLVTYETLESRKSKDYILGAFLYCIYCFLNEMKVRCVVDCLVLVFFVQHGQL